MSNLCCKRHFPAGWNALTLCGLLLAAGCGTSNNGTPGVFYQGGEGLRSWSDINSQFGNPDGAVMDAGGATPTDNGGADAGSAEPADAGSTQGLDVQSGGSKDSGDNTGGPKAADLDKDGFSPNQGDCDDFNAKIHPGAQEVCDQLDNDCNGIKDDVDVDKDGFYNCEGTNKDCNDHDKNIHPGAPLQCAPGMDANCNGKPDVDENVDADGDGFSACKDCDDTDKAVFPGAPQSCLNNKDNDCDGVIDAQVDKDGDGFGACPGPNADCDDNDKTVYPGAPELCDKKDNDCNDNIDDNDMDGDGYYGCDNDCDDNDININPGAGRDCKNGKDNDCSGIIDSKEDGDKDGFAGCSDCNDYDPDVNPKAYDAAGDMMDNDCDGQTDEVPPPCDVPNLNSNNADDYAKAIDLCVGVQSSTFPTLASTTARAIHKNYGSQIVPQSGPNLVVISSGVAAAKGQPGYVNPQSGKAFSNSAAYPPVACKKSGSVYDYTEWKLVIKVPGNASSFSFMFNFMSAEYPEYVNSQYDDKFLAVLDSKKFKGNISFDSKGKCISINSAFFTVCKGCKYGEGQLTGTGYEGGIGGGTGWLKTTSPVTPGETITLRFIVFDEGDHILDSVVMIDDFQWELGTSTGGPSTIRPGG